MNIKIILVDEVNASIKGLSKNDLLQIIEKTKIFIPSARHNAAFKLKRWDGKKSNVSDTGNTFIQSIKAMIDIEEYTDLKDRIDKLEKALNGQS